jgi:Rad3-related DNA helicase
MRVPMASSPNSLELFDELVHSGKSKITRLWDHQQEVLARFEAGLSGERRIGIELPTGAGKTLIALLILESRRLQGKRVAILTSSKALAEDVSSKADDLGIATVVVTGSYKLSEEELRERSSELRQYKRAQTIAVMNYWAYLYGDFLTPDLLVVDDAHSFENAAQDRFTLEIDRDEHGALFEGIVSKLRTAHPIYQRLAAIQQRIAGPDSYETIYLPHLREVASDIVTYYRGRAAAGHKDWDAKRNLERFHKYAMFVDPDAITLSPPVPPMELEDKFRSVGSILYMSATLGTSEVFQKSVGSEIAIRTLRDEELVHRVGTMGQRMIFPLRADFADWELGRGALDTVVRILQHFGKAIVFTTSKPQREAVSNFLKQASITVFHYNSEVDAETFSGIKAGALVTAGRYVGLDLPSNICNVGIIVRIPFAVSPFDAFTQEHLAALDFSYQKVAHRLVQAFGRCNRSSTDRAVYFVLDGRLEAEIDGEERLLPYFPRELLAQTELGYDLARRDIARALDIGKRFVDGQFPEYETELKRTLRGIPIRTATTAQGAPSILTEIRGWGELVQNSNYYEAAQIFRGCANPTGAKDAKPAGPDARAAWFHYWAAMCDYLQLHFQSGGDNSRTSAMAELNQAVRLGPSSWFKGLRTVLNELDRQQTDSSLIVESATLKFCEGVLRRWEDFRRENTRKSGKITPATLIQTAVERFQEGTHAQIVEAAEMLFHLMGFEVRNSSNQVGEPDLQLYATDCERPFLTLVEVKSVDQGGIDVSKSDVDQAKGPVDRYSKKYAQSGMSVIPLIATNKDTKDQLATQEAAGTCRIASSDVLVQLLRGYQRLVDESATVESNSVARLDFMHKIPPQADILRLLTSGQGPRIDGEEIVRLFSRN